MFVLYAVNRSVLTVTCIAMRHYIIALGARARLPRFEESPHKLLVGHH